MEKKKIFFSAILGLVIIATLILLFVYSDTAFTNNATIVYDDGCIETYKNSVLISEPCVQKNLLMGSDKWESMILENPR